MVNRVEKYQHIHFANRVQSSKSRFSLERIANAHVKTSDVISAWNDSTERLCVVAIPCNPRVAHKIAMRARQELRRTDSVRVQNGLVQIVALTNEQGLNQFYSKTSALAKACGAYNLRFSSFGEPDDLFGAAPLLMNLALGIDKIDSSKKTYISHSPVSPKELQTHLETAYELNPFIGKQITVPLFAKSHSPMHRVEFEAKSGGYRPWRMSLTRKRTYQQAGDSYEKHVSGSDVLIYLESRGREFEISPRKKRVNLESVYRR